jgi:drug/metabolite transporter (DMT)-like permease
MGYFFIALMLALTLYGQLVIKWRVNLAGPMPAALHDKLHYVGTLVLSPWVLSGLAAAFLASICWIFALTKLELGRAYPFTALTLVLVMAASFLVFGEPMGTGKIAGTALIVAGVLVIARYA